MPDSADPSPGKVPVPIKHRLVSAVLLTLFCLVSYGTVNAIAEARGVTRCLAAAWELKIPRLNWLVLPYWSVDILLALSPLMAADPDEWRTLLRRLFWAFTAACLIFLIFPFRCAYPRMIPDDWTGPLFALLHATDLPYNQAPSLHVAEAILFAPVYLARISSPGWRTAFIAWLAMGCAATVLTHQHHLADFVTGAAFGALLLKLIPRREGTNS